MARTQTLNRTDLFGFVPGGHVLDTEMAYGGYDPQDWHQRRGGPVVAEEEAYGEDDEHFSLRGEDDDVEFGGDLEDVPLFGAEKETDEVDDQLDSILSDMDKDDEFGADPMEVPPEVEGLRDDLAAVILDGVRDAFWGTSKASPDSWSALFRRGAEKASNMFESLQTPGDMEEIAQALLAQGEAFTQWNSLSAEQKEAMVSSAISYASVPGIEHGVDDAVVDAWGQGLSGISAENAGKIFWAAFSDAKKTFYAALAENPVFGNLMQMAGVDPKNADQMVNFRAISLVLLMRAGVPIASYVAKSIDVKGGAIIAAASAGMYARSGNLTAGSVSVEAEAAVEELVVAPVQELPDNGWGMPAPEQILAFGYGVSILGSLMKIF